MSVISGLKTGDGKRVTKWAIKGLEGVALIVSQLGREGALIEDREREQIKAVALQLLTSLGLEAEISLPTAKA